VGAERASAGEQSGELAALRYGEELRRTLVERSDDLIFVIDGEDRVRYVNPAAAALFRSSPEEMIGRRRAELFPPDLSRQQASSVRRVLESGQPFSHDDWIVYPEGRLWVNTRLLPLRDAAGRVTMVLGISRDLSDRKRTEDALRASEASYRAIFAAANDAMFVHDGATGEITDANPRMCEMYGYAPQEILGKLPGAFSSGEPPFTQENALARFRAAAAGVPQFFEWRVRNKAGDAFWVEVGLKKALVGGRESVLAVVRDISKRKRAEDALRESEERYRAIFEQAADSVVLLDTGTGALLDFNDRAHEGLGYTRGEFSALTLGQIDAIESPEETVQHCAKVVREGADAFETKQRTKSGEVRDVQVRARRISIRGRDYILGVWHDITDRKRAEEGLRLSELQYRSTLDSLGDAVHVLDRDLRIVLINQAFRDWMEALRLPVDVEGRTVLEVFPFLPERVRDEYRQVFDTGKALVTEEATRVGAREIITETRKIPVFEGDRVARVITVVRDITERRKFEQELLKTQKLETIGLLAGGIAHDFNNLLAGVLTNLAVARQKASGDPSLGRALAEAERAAYRARGLTQRLLTFSGGGDPVRQSLALGPLLRETAEIVLAGSDVRCGLAVPDALWPAHADAQQIGQVLQNLLINARQAMPDGGTVALEAENAEVGPDNPLRLSAGRFVRIRVADHGVGIAPEDLARVFDPFFTTKESGTGLGLTASYAIVKKHGGAIDVQSQPGVGTTVHVYLPASDAPPAPPPPVAPAGPCTRILLMDDDVILRRGARRLLRQHGYDVECARDGAEAVRLYAQAREAGEPFDAVILDLTVAEGMGGEECARALRALDRGVKAIACTGYAEDDVLAGLRAGGFGAFLRKPFSPEELADALRRIAAAGTP